MADDISIPVKITCLRIECSECKRVTDALLALDRMSAQVPVPLHHPGCSEKAPVYGSYTIETPRGGCDVDFGPTSYHPSAPISPTCPCGIDRRDCEYHKP